jgi:hypothetical protein
MSSWDDTFELSSFEWGGKSLIHSAESVATFPAFSFRSASVLTMGSTDVR